MRFDLSKLGRSIASVVVALGIVMALVGSPIVAPDMQDRIDPVDDSEAIGPIPVAVGLMAIGGASGIAIWEKHFDNADVSEETVEDLKEADAHETHANLYAMGSQIAEQIEVSNNGYNTMLQNSKTIARMEGKNAYIKAREDGKSHSVAQQEAVNAVEDYYSHLQIEMKNQWNVAMEGVETIYTTAGEQSNLTQYDVIKHLESGTGYHNGIDGFGNYTRQTANSSDVNFTRTSNHISEEIFIYPADSELDDAVIANGKMMDYYEQMGSDADTVVSEIVNVTDGWATAKQEGKIESWSQQLDPYILERNYGPEDGDVWERTTLARAGIAPPINQSSDSYMVIQDHAAGVERTGVLLSDDQPTDGFNVGETYDAQALEGPQLVDDGDGLHELEGNFTISESEGYGENGTITYNTPEYETSNISEYIEQQEEIRDEIEEIQDRQEQLLTAISSGSEFMSQYGWVVLILAGVALYRVFME